MKKIFRNLMAIAIAGMTFTACEDVPAPYDVFDEGTVIEAAGSGTVADPFNVKAAIAKCKEIGITESTEKYYIKGIAATMATADGTFGNATFDIVDVEGGDAFKCYQVAGANGQKLPAGFTINKGDEVVVFGPIYNYNGKTPETAGKGAAYIVSVNGKSTDDSSETPSEVNAKSVTIAEFNAAAESSEWYQLTGIVKNLKDGDKFGNFDLQDETGSVYVYGLLSEQGGAKQQFQELAAEKGIKNGSKLTIIGNRGSYKDKIEVVNAFFVKVEEGGGEQPAGEAKGTGSEADPFNVAGAIAKCQAIGQTASSEKYYVTGIAQSEATADATYGNITFDIADSEGGAKFKCYQVAGSNGEKLPAGFSIKKGDVLVVYGPIYNYSGNTPETAGKSAAYIVTVNGKATNEGGDTGNQMGTADSPITVAAALTIINGLSDGSTTETEAYVKGKIKSITEISTSYGNATYIISDEGASNELTVFRGKGLDGASFTSEEDIKVGDEVVLKGKLQKYVKNEVVTPEITGSSIVKLNGQGGESGGQGEGGGETASSLTNGDFETWAEGVPTGWKSASTASSATLTQSTDAHGGSYSCNVNGKESSNVRLASQEITLAAGTYTFSFWVKPTTEEAVQVRPGYVAVVNNAVSGSYQYGDYATLASGWQQVSYDFTLSAETTVCLVVMNPKKSSYSSGKDVLVDDASLTKK